jgi:hypothetical protein
MKIEKNNDKSKKIMKLSQHKKEMVKVVHQYGDNNEMQDNDLVHSTYMECCLQ